jgi:hypothetical protein
MGREGLLGLGTMRTAAHGLVPAALRVSRRTVPEEGRHDGCIRLGDVQRVPMVAD